MAKRFEANRVKMLLPQMLGIVRKRCVMLAQVILHGFRRPQKLFQKANEICFRTYILAHSYQKHSLVVAFTCNAAVDSSSSCSSWVGGRLAKGCGQISRIFLLCTTCENNLEDFLCTDSSVLANMHQYLAASLWHGRRSWSITNIITWSFSLFIFHQGILFLNGYIKKYLNF